MSEEQDYINILKKANAVLLMEAKADYEVGIGDTKPYILLKRRIERMEKNITDELERLEKINERLEGYLMQTNEKWQRDL